MPFSRFVEARIDAAMAEGEFDNLSCAGQPLDLEEYFSAPADMRMAYSILKNANCVPTEVELMREIAKLRESVAVTPDGASRKALERRLADRQTQLAVLLERRRLRRT